MKRQLSTLQAWAILLLLIALCQPAAKASENGQDPVAIGSRLELFLDRFLIDRLEGATLRLHHPVEQPAQLPFQGHYMTILKEGPRYRAYYRNYLPGSPGPHKDGSPDEITCVAESRDGLRWVLPELGLFEVAGSRANNVVLAGMPPFMHNFSPFVDGRPGVPAGERYKALAGIVRSGGLFPFVSADGFHWKKAGDTPVITWAGSAFDSQNIAFWSEAEQQYVCYFRFFKKPENLRSIARATSKDFLHWSAGEELRPNLKGEHLYTNGTHPYFRAPHIYIALATRFFPDRGNSTEIVLMSSRAGSPYERTFKEAFIRPGLDAERWTNRANYAALNVVPTGPAEMSIYNGPAGRRYTLRTDGFVSVNAPHEGGELVTRPLTFTGDGLYMNFSSAASGGVQVEIQDAGGKPLPGYALADCPPIYGDAIEQRVKWKGGDAVSALAGRAVRLRFVMKDCDLYAIQFK